MEDIWRVRHLNSVRRIENINKKVENVNLAITGNTK